MKITFPNLGNTIFAAKAVFDGLDIDYVLPPKSNKTILENGCLYSPEEICLPFKIMIGSYIESIKKGADTILLVGSCGPCRFGEYCELQMNVLKNLGYNLNFIVIDSPGDIGTKEFMRRLSEINNESSKSTHEKLKVLFSALKIINLIDSIEKKAKYMSGYEINTGECKSILRQCKEDAIKCNSPYKMLSTLKYYKNKLDGILVDKNKNPLRIAVIGEIYTIIEPFSNLFIEDKLLNYGTSVTRYLTPSWWIKNTLLSVLKLNSPRIRSYSKKYLPFYIGGHARECIGEAMIAKKDGLDGAIQIFPMGCMPEIVSKSILPTISRNEDLPILTLVVDELTGEDGYITRIEAFLDLLERRKSKCII
ncbi:MAG: acyl-CoA dehydratase activase-related protein [Clostridium sp.]|jgi:predicted nucleotide-binding protein (sugar kinase/HSP70/actin superfamily)|nr:acyl-CoA dehydratase activase-related protein [Clostridium sp.]MCH3963843.1 acyl-CoA dehydratase activase-related protein [Clostridium sp.]MCI1716962.1 acyl-CoA dehydratase activase-related protein [Clostridium sp.]MCI1801319.1 acyl-CoA dehydratase activase-related protein [Clostridium sp.]MCI1815165.1 acyl-CoA dehydratase activase-related protein [Clostridium sp.]MCI1872051.1 acyl-CoA dehydratase activase-related protein [Clostridium sp.]